MPTTPPTISALPAVPDRADRATFSTRATNYFDALKNTFAGEVSAVATNVYANAAEAATSASTAGTAATTATTQAGLAETAKLAAQAAQAAAEGVVATIPSGTINDATTGTASVWSSSKVSSELAGKQTASANLSAWSALATSAKQDASANLSAWSALATSAKQDALVSGTSIKTINSTSLLGSGDIVLGTAIYSATTITNNTTLTAADNAKYFRCPITAGNLTITLPAVASAGNGWFVIVRSDVAKDRSTAVTISVAVPTGVSFDGVSNGSLSVQPGLSYLLLCDGTAFYTQKLDGRGVLQVNSGTSWTCPVGVRQAKIHLFGGGGGGGGGHASASHGSGGGGGGMAVMYTDLSPGTAYTIAIGAAGTAGPAGAAGGTGGTTSITISGVTSSATGGSGGAAGSATATAITAGGQGGQGSLANETGYSQFGPYGGFSVGTTNTVNPAVGFIAKGNMTARGGNGGSINSAGSVGYAGAIVIEY